MLQDIVLHNLIVTVGIYTDVRVMGEAEVYDAAKDSVNLRVTGYSMYYVIRSYIIEPFTFINPGVSRFWGL